MKEQGAVVQCCCMSGIHRACPEQDWKRLVPMQQRQLQRQDKESGCVCYTSVTLALRRESVAARN